MLREEQIDLRRQRARTGRFRIDNLTPKRVFSDFRVTNPATGGTYTVAVRGFAVGDNTCTCPDFKANTLGTCKHIEAVLESLKDEVPAHVRQRKAASYSIYDPARYPFRGGFYGRGAGARAIRQDRSRRP